MNNTRVISCRLPFEEYVKAITEAQEQNLSINDYIIGKLYTNHQEKVQTYEAEISRHLADLEALENRCENLEADCQQYLVSIQEARQALDQYKLLSQQQAKEIQTLKQTCQSQGKTLTELQTDKERLGNGLKKRVEQCNEMQQAINAFESEINDLKQACEVWEAKEAAWEIEHNEQKKAYQQLVKGHATKEAQFAKDHQKVLQRLEILEEARQQQKAQIENQNARQIAILEAISQTFENFKVKSFENPTKAINRLRSDVEAALREVV
ncbi:MAG: hypothetical protein HC913_14965 [Microscillaceae bacterium]|nr:hypothetical protein [Microscillaceae bacterium]